MRRCSAVITRSGLLSVVLLALIAVWGCSSQPQYGDKKEDWAKTKPPPTWHGPGQPSGPPMASMTGPHTPVPANAPGRGGSAPGGTGH